MRPPDFSLKNYPNVEMFKNIVLMCMTLYNVVFTDFCGTRIAVTSVSQVFSNSTKEINIALFSKKKYST